MQTTFSPSYRGGSGPPLVLLHGFTATWRVWELVLPALEEHFEVFAPTLPGHAGGPALSGDPSTEEMLDLLEGVLDEAGIGTAHIVGNSLGGYAALHLRPRRDGRSGLVSVARVTAMFYALCFTWLISQNAVGAAAVLGVVAVLDLCAVAFGCWFWARRSSVSPA